MLCGANLIFKIFAGLDRGGGSVVDRGLAGYNQPDAIVLQVYYLTFMCAHPGTGFVQSLISKVIPQFFHIWV
jgi:hypothetical protein